MFTFGVYCATKAGVISLTRSTSQVSELHNITISNASSWSLIDDVVEAYFKCIYNPKLNGIIFQFGIKKWGRKIRKPHGSN
ncbi:hypothetical protein RhiirA4_482212 [Rhizophagus irregularis]|uniref:Uncharacterized protein n=1 Tax=Rhizophagus irregularis TaxID=588596 RepID=A0A2I1HKP0_9GLOM|nr:hypothetical protein RhiirA4_482212 [Rhizophagus irregularis]